LLSYLPKVLLLVFRAAPTIFRPLKSPTAKDLVRKLLVPDQTARLDASQGFDREPGFAVTLLSYRAALEHAWLRTVAPLSAPIQSTASLQKYNVSRRFQNTGKQLLHAQRFRIHAQEEGETVFPVVLRSETSNR
jgi:hypothetical protein